MTLEVTYLGNKGTHGFVGDGPTYNINQPGLGAGVQSCSAGTCAFVPNVPQAQRRPLYNRFSYPGFIDPTTNATLTCCFTDQGNYLGNDASSTYEALTVKLDKRFSQGLQFTTFYNFAHSYHYDSNFYADIPRVAYGPDDNIRNHQWISDLVYQLPVGRGQKFAGNAGKALDEVIGGWQITGTMNWSGGLPWTAGLNGDICNLEQDTGICRPNRGSGSFNSGAGSFVHNNTGHYVQFFTPLVDSCSGGLCTLPTGSGFADPGLNNIGNFGYDTLRGPRYFGADASLAKVFKITERAALQFRVDAFNVFNHPVLGFNQNQGGSGTCIDCGGNGRVTDIEADASPGSPAGMRQIQFGLRFSF
jgi:hypothetical protein